MACQLQQDCVNLTIENPRMGQRTRVNLAEIAPAMRAKVAGEDLADEP